MTETARRLRRLGAPHARARALAAALAGVGAALAVAAAGVQLAPAAIAVTLAWIVMVAVAAMALRLAARAARAVADGLVGRLVERHAGARAGSVVGLLAPRAGGSADLLAAADARAASVVGATAPAVRRALAEGTWRGLAAAAGVAALGAVLFVAAAPASGRAAAFWHPLRTLADARAPVRVSVDRSAVHRGDSVTVSIVAPGAARATLWRRGPGEAWRAEVVPLGAEGRAARRLGPLEHDLFLRASSGGRRSAEVRVAVALPAFLAALEITARFPPYLDRPDEPVLTGVDTVTVPEGTTLVTRGAASVLLRAAAWTAGPSVVALRVDGSAFAGALTPRAGGAWRLALATVDGAPLEGDAATLVVRVIADSAPTVAVPVPGDDTTLPLSLRQPLVIDVRDDHGVARLAVVSWRVSQTGKVGDPVRDSLDVSGVGDRAILQAELDARQRGLLPGDTLRFRVEAWDNAPPPGPHAGRSREFALRLLSREELRAAARDATQALASAADSVSAEQRRLADRTADLAQQRSRESPEGGDGRETAGRQAGALPFEASQRAEALARQQAAVSDKVRELAQAVEEVARAAAAAGVTDSAFQARLAEVREMLQRAITPELEQRLRELQEALSRLDPEATRRALQRLAEAQQQLRQELERSRELFRRAAVEGALSSLAADAEDLRRRQDEWNRGDARRADSAAAAAERDLAAGADSLARDLERTGHDLVPPESDRLPAALQPPRAALSRARAAMGRAAQAAGQRDAAGAEQSGREAEDALDDLPEMLRARRDSLAGEWRRETLEALDRAMSEAAALAQRQEQVADGLRQPTGTAGIRAQEASIEEGAEAIARQVREAAGKHALVSPGLESAIGFAQRQMRAAREQLEQAQPNVPAAQALAEDALDALNATVYALARSREAVSGARSGSGFQEAVEQLARMAGQQQGLAGDAQGLLPLMGMGGPELLQQMRALAARQRALAEQLERLRAEGASGAAGPLAQEARDLARQLDAGRLDRQTVERQQRLYRRLLDAGRTLTGPEPDENRQRTSRPAIGDSVHLPGVLAPGATGTKPRLQYPTWEELTGLTPEQRRLVLEYFRRLNAPAASPARP